MPRALTHTRITWALTPMVLQVLVSLRGPYGVVGTPHEEVRNIPSTLQNMQWSENFGEKTRGKSRTSNTDIGLETPNYTTTREF